MTDETGLVQYDAMRQALQCCARIDEVKDIHDKAKAMELYALQTKDKEMETWVAEIKQRAKLRMGELARELQTSNGGQSTHVDSTLSTTRKSTKGQAPDHETRELARQLKDWAAKKPVVGQDKFRSRAQKEWNRYRRFPNSGLNSPTYASVGMLAQNTAGPSAT